MKRHLRQLSGVTLMVLFGMNSVAVLGQQGQQAQKSAEDRKATIERQRTAQAPNGPLADRIFFEQSIATQGPGPQVFDYVFLATEMSFGGKLVKGAPYSAQAVTETTQTLSDGNRITNRSTATVYRDSEGRSRREQALRTIGQLSKSGEPSQTIYINDPVAGTAYTIDPNSQTATKMPPMRFKISSPGKENSTFEVRPLQNGQYRLRAQHVDKELAQNDRYRIAIENDASNKRTTESGIALGFLDANNPNAKKESLGKQNINGVEAEGTRSTVTIPAGEIGNERAIEIVSERWYSPELQVIVMTRHSDPRFGETTYQLTNINRNEPSRELFEVPAGYTVKESQTFSPTQLRRTYNVQ